MTRSLPSFLLLLSLPALAAAQAPAPRIDGDALMGHIKMLASDEFEGRAPGTAGEKKTVDYLVQQFTKIGLAPGNPDGTYLQRVPLVGITAAPARPSAGRPTRSAPGKSATTFSIAPWSVPAARRF